MKAQMEERIVTPLVTQFGAWKKVKLGEVCVSIADGDHQAPPKAEKGVPFVTISNIDSHNCMDFTNTMFVTEEYYDKLDNKRKPQKNDVLYSVVGSFGKPVFVKEDVKFVFQRHIAILRPNEEIVNPMFMYYTMLSNDFYHQADAVALGAAQRTISLTSLRNMEIALPPRSVQDTIATTLSRYDALISNYLHQIKLLEEAAQRLYKEWFVDLHFPGHENVKVTDGVPEGWEKKKLVDLVEVLYGYAFDGKLFNQKNQGKPIVRIRNIPTGRTEDYTTEDASTKYVIHNGDILVGMDGEFHINSWSGTDAYLVQRACSFLPKTDALKGFLFQAIVSPIKFFEKTLVGATVAHLGKKHIDSIEILLADDETLYVPFQRYFRLRQKLLNSITLLTESRDRLLPKLMSGEIEL